MTAKKVIDECDALCPNAFTDEEKLLWLWRLDAAVCADCARYRLFGAHETPYTLQSALLLEDAFCDVYVKYLLCQIDFANAEFGRYNASAAHFNAAYSRFLDHMARTCSVETSRGVIV